MADTPNSYRDPYWVALADTTGDKLGLPPGLLSSVVTKGERSNHDQVSEAGAKTVFQIIPSTRDAALKKYGVDAYLSPENAAEVAGRLLKDSLDRNKGNPYAAVAEYHGGTDRGNWGTKTRAYVARVMDSKATPDAPAAPQAGQSTFQRVLAQQQTAAPANAIASVYDAYKAGKMTPEEAADFESDVKAGVVMLPRGATLAGQQAPAGPTAAPQAIMLPKEVTDAYTSGKMTDQERADLEADMRAGIVKLPPTMAAASIPTNDPNWKPATEQGIIQRQPEPTLGQKVVGAGEAALTTVTGATGGALGMVGGTVKGVTQSLLDGSFGTQQAQQMVENEAMKGAGALTYAPRTATGQEYTQNVGDALRQTIPVMPLTAEMGAIGASMKAAAPVAQARVVAPATQAASRAGEAVQSVASKVANTVRGEPAVTPTPGTMASGGAAATDVATMRQAAAHELPVPVELTKGQATRDFEQLRFEQETAKNPELGAPIRERAAEQHKAVRQSFDAWIDQTGAEAPDARGTGIAVDKALQTRAARDKAEIRVAYKEAEKAPEALNPVDPGASVSLGSGEDAINGSVIDYLNSKPTGLKTTALTDHAKQYAVKLGVAEKLDDGSLVARPTNVKTMEALRREISQATGYEPAEIRDATILKKMIDAQTEDAAGPLYAKARALRAKYAEQYENRAVISDLLNNKRGMNDRKVALEDVFDRVVFRGSLDDMRYARKMLQTGGEEGKQAWKEIQGQVVRYIRDEATKNVARDATGNEMISPAALDKAIRRLDGDGKLDYLFGRRGAEQLRAVNDLAKVMFTTPPGAVNTSNTASVLLAAMDMALSGTAGMPLPVMSGLRMMVRNIKDRKLKARVNDALGKSF